MMKKDDLVATERRQFGRRWSRVHCWIKLSGRPRIAATILNFSEGGALLEVDWSVDRPNEFVLEIEPIDFEISCEVVYAYKHKLGVKFVAGDAKKRRDFYQGLDELANEQER